MSYNNSRGSGSRSSGMGFAGFTMPKRNPSNVSLHAVPPPPPSSGLSKQGYSTMDSITQNALTSPWGSLGKKRSKTEDEYFDEDEETVTPELAYIPAPGSPTYQSTNTKKAEDDEEDPLDAFMSGLEAQAARDLLTSGRGGGAGGGACAEPGGGAGGGARGQRGDIDQEDNEESYYRYMEENPLGAGADDTSDTEIEYDEDGNPIPPPKKKTIDPLPPIDHSQIEYQPFEKNFYTPHPDIENLSHEQVEELKKTLGVKITGPDPPKPVTSFGHFNFDEALMKQIRKSEFTQPTPVQAAAIPAALSGRDIIGIAKTGSGKTAAFLWPLLVHIMDQKELAPGDGPIGLILAPTRELAQQIYMEAKKFGKVYNIRCVCCYGGGSKWEQIKALEGGGAEVIVATPGRIIDLVKCKATNLQRVTYLVLDEADRMFHMGFEPQVRSVCTQVRPSRQTLLFSATFPRRVERLARDALHDPVRVLHGAAGEANADVLQTVQIFSKPEQKWKWLLNRLVEFTSAGSVLIFVTKKLEAEQVAASLGAQQVDALLLHGDMEQAERNKVITSFKRQDCNILVATDVAARGLDIPHVRTVVNYTVARDIDTHTHRVGRTGRAGVVGHAVTLLDRTKDKEFAGHLVRNLEGANQEVSEELLSLALQSGWFRKSRFKQGRAKNVNVGGCGLGYRERALLPPPAATAAPAPSAHAGPATDRLAAMKQAFRSQYSQFTASSDHSWEQTTTSQQQHEADDIDGVPLDMPPPPPPPPPPSASDRVRKGGKRSRWE